jgi:hypothetical protein
MVLGVKHRPPKFANNCILINGLTKGFPEPWNEIPFTLLVSQCQAWQYDKERQQVLVFPNVKLDTTERTGFSQYSIHTLQKIQQKILRKETQCTFQLECVCVCVCFLGTFLCLFWWMCQQVYGVVNNFDSSLCPCIWHAPIVACQKEFQFEGYKDNFNLIFFFSFFQYFFPWSRSHNS